MPYLESRVECQQLVVDSRFQIEYGDKSDALIHKIDHQFFDGVCKQSVGQDYIRFTWRGIEVDGKGLGLRGVQVGRYGICEVLEGGWHLLISGIELEYWV